MMRSENVIGRIMRVISIAISVMLVVIVLELPLYAKAFYAALADAGLAMVSYASRFSLERAVVLSGTLFMDEILSDATERLLTAHGYTVYQHEKTPADESGICTGQAYAAGMT